MTASHLQWGTLAAMLLTVPAAHATEVTVHNSDAGSYIEIDGKKTLIYGMNWGYMPIGENYAYDFWGRDDAFIESALRPEMQLLKDMGVNAIRQYAVIPPKWVEWIHAEYEIYTMINPLFGRYGINVDGTWIPHVDYANPALRKAIMDDSLAAVETYKDTEGVIMWLLGNENNYGLHWTSFEIEDLPESLANDPQAQNAAALYSLYGEVITAIQQLDDSHPVSICNGDLQYLELIERYASHVDILGTNVYRGKSARDLFQRVKDSLGVPVMFAEFGADAFNARKGQEDHLSQARYLTEQWREIYEQSHGMGGVGNAIGGYVFQWSDGWWKHKQTENLDVHDQTASWANRGYPDDYVEGGNNMNEEWFGIAAKGQSDASGRYDVYPRAAYYALRDAWRLDPYEQGVTRDQIAEHFRGINPADYDPVYKAAIGEQRLRSLEGFRLERFRAEMKTFAGTSAKARGTGKERAQYDHMQSIYMGATATPQPNVRAEVDFNVLGHVPDQLMDDIFYESRGRDIAVLDEDGEPTTVNGADRVRVYRAKLHWDDPAFTLDGYFREGHYHWGYEGDFFGLYREAYYGPNIDIYDADVPIGVEIAAKKNLQGLKLAAGPQVFWGANPTAIAKYQRPLGRGFTATVMHQEDIAAQSTVSTSRAVPEPVDRRSSTHLEYERGSTTLEAGVLWSGSQKVGREFVVARQADGEASYAGSGYHFLDDTVVATDALGAKIRITHMGSPVSAYAQGMYKGLVSDGGPNQTMQVTGWSLKEDGRGNQISGMAGMALGMGDVQIAPHALYQKPLEGPLPAIEGQLTDGGQGYYRPVSLRNVMTDPFAVLGNRETIGLELLLSYDPTPGSWMWDWDNDQREDAPFAASLNFVYRIQPTSRDANFGFTEDGLMFSFGGAPPAENVWEANGRFIINPSPLTRLIGHVYTGSVQSTGSSSRTVLRKGGDITLWANRWVVIAKTAFDDWGPYDFHRDFNITFPLQVNTEVSYGLTRPEMDKPRTSIGLTGKFRTLNEFSGGMDTVVGQDYELEIGSVLVVAM